METSHGDGRVAQPRRQVEDWENWSCDDEDDVLTLIDVNEPLPAYGTKLAERGANILRTKRSNSPERVTQRGQANADALFANPGIASSLIKPKQSQNTTVPTSSHAQPSRRSIKHLSTRASKNVMGRISRPSLKKRQKPAQSKLRLITDMSTFKRPNQVSKRPSPVVRPAKFVDLAALAALEGDPTPASFGNWGWLRKTIMQSPKELSPRTVAPGQTLSPDDRPIMIGITLPPEEAASRGTRYQTGEVKTHFATDQQISRRPLPETALRPLAGQLDTTSDANEPISVWSPDTPDTACSFASIRPASSIYSQMTTPGNAPGLSSANAPPVPAVPATFRSTIQQKPVNPRLDLLRNGGEDEDDSGTPYTLFEEDGTPVARKSLRGKLMVPTPSTANSASHGWWDHHLVTPFLDRTMSMSSRVQMATPSIGERDSRLRRQSLPDTDSHLGAKEQTQSSSFLRLGIAPENGLLISFGPDDISNTPKTGQPSIQKESHLLGGGEDEPEIIDVTAAWKALLVDEEPSSEISAALQRGLSPPTSKGIRGSPVASSGRSTPTLRVPTPRRTPPSAINAPRAETHCESSARHSPAVTQNGAAHHDISGSAAVEQRSVDIPPPYSPPKKQPKDGLSYQALFPPDHARNGHGQPQIKGAPGLASTLTSQGTGRRLAKASDKPRAEKSTEDIALMMSMATRPVPPHVPLEEDDQPRVDASSQSGKFGKPILDPQQSHFSLSPDSVRSTHSLGGDPGSLERRLMSTQNPPMPFLTQTASGHSDHRFERDLENMPGIPAKAYITHEPVGNSSPYARTWIVRTETGSPGNVPAPLPVRPTGTYLPEDHARAAEGPSNKIERQRRRHEKEDVAARRVGGFWRGRGCISTRGCFGRPGREGRKKRRIWMAVIGAIVAIILLATILGVTLAKHDAPVEAHSIWVNLTDFPPMPTGVLTFVGPDNTVSRSGCTEPSTLWSCSLPKDDQNSASPYQADQPTIIFQIQWDNSTGKGWDTPTGKSSDPLQVRDLIDGFQPNPNPPSYEEMWFLGETTDNVTSSQKAGEPAPFFISILNSVNETVSPPELNRRDVSPRGLKPNATTAASLPKPDLEADGSPEGAVMIPRPVQQPVRLYDRGLPTEHYGFYTYFDRTIFLKSVTVLNRTEEEVGLDKNGGCRKTEADFFVTWSQTRILVQIWTRQLGLNTTSLLPQTPAGSTQTPPPLQQLIRPGTMPYPVTVTMDTHGGDPGQKFVWDWPMNDRQQLELDKPDLLANNMAVGGSWINPRASGNATFGGYDGGTGGCKCQWVNFA